jgi:cytochrome c oxidase accessory protein FixG
MSENTKETEQNSTQSKKDYLKGWIPYRTKRYWFYIISTIIALVLPWIKVKGNHFFLLNFDHKQLHFLFTKFDMQELYLMPFLLMLTFLGIFALTAIGGRVWCGWACPQTIFRVIYRDLIETKILGLHKRISNKQKLPDMSKPANQIKKVIAILIWSVLALVAAADFMWYFIPPEEFMQYIQSPAEHTLLLGFIIGIALFIIIDIVFIKEDFCVYICPYSRVQSVLYDNDTIMAVYDPTRGGEIYTGEGNDKVKQYAKKKDLVADNPSAECAICEACVTVCPTHIDIRKGLQLECINCLECVDACTTKQAAFGRPSLVQWSSDRETLYKEGKTRYFRPKTIAYFTILSIVLIALFIMGSTKENMLLNINKSTRLYKITDDGKVQNDYIFLFQNTDRKAHKYFFEIQGNDKIKIIRPNEPFHLGAGKKKKKVVIFQTSEVLVKNTQKDIPLPITIKAYAVDDPKNIVVFRKTIFGFPRIDILEREKASK